MHSVCLLFRERLFWIFSFSLIWLLLGIANYMILLNRVSPFSFNDIKVLSSVSSIIRQYMGFPQLAGAVVLLGLCTLITVYVRKRVPKIDRSAHIVRDMLFLFLFMSCGVLSGGPREDPGACRRTAARRHGRHLSGHHRRGRAGRAALPHGGRAGHRSLSDHPLPGVKSGPFHDRFAVCSKFYHG